MKTKRYAPFLVVMAVALIYHLQMQPMGGDDVFFSQATAEKSLWAYLAERYQIWTSRVVSEAILVTIMKVPLLWRLIDFLMFASLPVLLAKIFGKKDALINWCAAGAVLLYPFHDMGTAGWITTTVTHFWPLWGFVFITLLVKKMLLEEKISPVEAVAGIFVAVMTGSHEQWAVVLFVEFVLYGFYLWKNKRKPANLPVFVSQVLVNLVSLTVIFMCPGNAARNAISIRDLPIYAEFNFGEKLYLGLLSIERVFIANADVVFFAVVFVWAALVYLKTNDYKKTLVSALPLLILFGQTVIRTAYPGLAGIFVMPEQILEWSWGELSTWIPMVYLAVTLGAMLYALYVLLGENLLEYIYALLMLGCGFGAGAVVGFMATIYVSGERVYAALYVALLCVTLYCIAKERERVQGKIGQTSGKLVVTVLLLLCLTNIGFIALSV